jgi:biotin carboxyl carrier protein
MSVHVSIDGNLLELELSRDGDACRFRLSHGPEERPWRIASLVQAAPGVYSVLLDGRSYDVRVEPGPERSFVSVQGRRFAVEVEDPREPRGRIAGPTGEGRQNVSAPMPGKIVRVLVAPGDAVEAGQGLVVVEAMKMQNEMKAPRAGRVVALSAREGGAVSAGEVLAIIE